MTDTDLPPLDEVDALMIAIVTVEAFATVTESDTLPPMVKAGAMLLADTILRRIKPLLRDPRSAQLRATLTTMEARAARVRETFDLPRIV